MVNHNTTKQKHIFKRNKKLNREYFLALSVIQYMEKSNTVTHKFLYAEV